MDAGRAVVERSGPAGPYGWVVMGVLWALDGAVTVMIFTLGMLLPEMREALGFSSVQGGLLGSTFFVAMATGSLPAAIWLSRFSPKRMTVIAAFGMAALAFAQGVAPGYVTLLAARMAFMYLAVMRIPAEILLIQQWFTGARVATVNSITIGSFGIGQFVAIAGTPLLLPLVNDWRGIHIVTGFLYLGIAVAWTVFGRERGYGHAPESGESSESAHVPSNSDDGRPFMVLRRRPILFLLASTQFGGAIAWASFITFFPTFGVEYRDLTLGEVGRIFVFFSVGAMIGSFSAGYLSNRIGRRKPLIFIPGFVMPVVYLGILSTTPIAWAPLLLVLGFMTSIVVPMVLTFPFDLGLAPREVAIGVGLVRTVTPLGSSLGPPLVGVLQESTGSLEAALFWVLPASVTVGVIGLTLPETSPLRRRTTARSSGGGEPTGPPAMGEGLSDRGTKSGG